MMDFFLGNVFVFFLPVLEYRSAVWCSAVDTHLKLLGRAVSAQGARAVIRIANFKCYPYRTLYAINSKLSMLSTTYFFAISYKFSMLSSANFLCYQLSTFYDISYKLSNLSVGNLLCFKLLTFYAISCKLSVLWVANTLCYQLQSFCVFSCKPSGIY